MKGFFTQLLLLILGLILIIFIGALLGGVNANAQTPTYTQERIVNHINGLIMIDETVPWQADVNEDGYLEVYDPTGSTIITEFEKFEDYLSKNMSKRSKRRLLKAIDNNFVRIIVINNKTLTYRDQIYNQYRS